jgi:hypothetical protein
LLVQMQTQCSKLHRPVWACLSQLATAPPPVLRPGQLLTPLTSRQQSGSCPRGCAWHQTRCSGRAKGYGWQAFQVAMCSQRSAVAVQWQRSGASHSDHTKLYAQTRRAQAYFCMWSRCRNSSSQAAVALSTDGHVTHSLKVCEPAPSSGVLVLPTTMAPLASSCCTRGSSVAATRCSYSLLPCGNSHEQLLLYACGQQESTDRSTCKFTLSGCYMNDCNTALMVTEAHEQLKAWQWGANHFACIR